MTYYCLSIMIASQSKGIKFGDYFLEVCLWLKLFG